MKLTIENNLTVRGLVFNSTYGYVDSRIIPARLVEAVYPRDTAREYEIEVELMPAEKGGRLETVSVPEGYRRPNLVEFLHFAMEYTTGEKCGRAYGQRYDGKPRGTILSLATVKDGNDSLYGVKLYFYGNQRGLGVEHFYCDKFEGSYWLLWVKE
jgi:hypothetical protein